MTVLHNEIEAKGATLTQAEAEKFARKAGVTEGRKAKMLDQQESQRRAVG